MKRIVVMALLALALPMAAFAGGVDFGNSGGTLTGSSAGLTLSGSELTQVMGLGGGGLIQGGLGTVTFSTGSLMSGNLTSNAVFAGGGSFTITGDGMGGVPNGVIFSGSFNGPVTWMVNPKCGPGGAVCYTLSGSITGTWYNGQTVSGATTQITFNAGKDGFMGSVSLGSGNTVITTVPEPGTLGLLGTGLVGLAGIVRKKLKA
jgi:hypothetical protein